MEGNGREIGRRKLLVRYEKLSETYEALLHLAAAIICWRKVGVIYG